MLHFDLDWGTLLKPMTKERSREYAKFLLIFVFLGFIMKIFSEFIHEMGHTFMVLMLGGKIIEISIRAEWPFALSHTQWAIPNPSNVGLALVAIAGILFETMTSIIGQSILILRRKMRPVYAISLFWLSFWTYLSPVVYLLMGAFHPFGDILDLMNALPVSCYFIGSLGIVMLIICTYLLSYALRDIFSNVLGLSMASDAVNYFWAFLHVFFILVTIITYGLPTPPAVTVVSMVAIFIWSYITAKWLFVFVSRQGGVKRLWLPEYAPNSMSSTPIESRDRKLKLGYVALFSVALISMLMTGFIINQYLVLIVL